MTEDLTITLSPGSIMNYSTSTTVSPSTTSSLVSEPMSLLLVGTSLIGLGVSFRRQQAANAQRRMS